LAFGRQRLLARFANDGRPVRLLLSLLSAGLAGGGALDVKVFLARQQCAARCALEARRVPRLIERANRKVAGQFARGHDGLTAAGTHCDGRAYMDGDVALVREEL